ncbi:uncharacterized protein EV422DRAFT_597243 [Fimicolochytrium jonesii]|uniref:uncharacterized protein n=1 Tax=Fimicolochytrium jonesii TaxID=1396493 RepID=UPI0022FE1F56|nr:uncharacterized protein EV422DRAFT_597243 [Fimicolochytrium jonesii]KAI8820226.1 hypothetical protein EV422DRAFT_597243 [Fimicolochytrium jonesii]
MSRYQATVRRGKAKRPFDPAWIYAAIVNPPNARGPEKCYGCDEVLPPYCYSETQWRNKRRRCRKCIEEYRGSWVEFESTLRAREARAEEVRAEQQLRFLPESSMSKRKPQAKMEKRIAAYHQRLNSAILGWDDEPEPVPMRANEPQGQRLTVTIANEWPALTSASTMSTARPAGSTANQARPPQPSGPSTAVNKPVPATAQVTNGLTPTFRPIKSTSTAGPSGATGARNGIPTSGSISGGSQNGLPKTPASGGNTPTVTTSTAEGSNGNGAGASGAAGNGMQQRQPLANVQPSADKPAVGSALIREQQRQSSTKVQLIAEKSAIGSVITTGQQCQSPPTGQPTPDKSLHGKTPLIRSPANQLEKNRVRNHNSRISSLFKNAIADLVNHNNQAKPAAGKKDAGDDISAMPVVTAAAGVPPVIVQPVASVPPAAEGDKGPVQVKQWKRLLLSTSPLISIGKRKLVRDPAIELQLGLVVRVGSRAFVIIEGEGERVASYLDMIKVSAVGERCFAGGSHSRKSQTLAPEKLEEETQLDPRDNGWAKLLVKNDGNEQRQPVTDMIIGEDKFIDR